jgi:hypothetical protein
LICKINGWCVAIYGSAGAQNMIRKQEEFETKEGVKGVKAYGTFHK